MYQALWRGPWARGKVPVQAMTHSLNVEHRRERGALRLYREPCTLTAKRK
jgi:hypothetical protein